MKKTNLKNKKVISQSFLEKNVDEKRKAISPLIATILLIVVAVAIIGIIVSWGKGFTTDSLSNTQKIASFKSSDVTHFIFTPDIKGRMLTFNYSPPNDLKNNEVLIIGYSLPGSSTLITLDENITLKEGYNGLSNLDLSSFDVSDRRTDLVLITSNNEYITLRNLDLLNYSPPPKICGGLPYIEYSGNFLCIHPIGSGTFQWGCSGTTTGATSNDDGRSNTEAIVSVCSDLSFAAKLCDDLEYGGFDDWYLPSTNQLHGLWLGRNNVILGDYEGDWISYSSQSTWSSTEGSSSNAYDYVMFLGSLGQTSKSSNYNVRCVRDH